MVKRIFKIVAIVLACCLVVTGGIIGIVAMNGGFNEEVINITKLYFGDDDTVVKKEFKTLDDVVANINYEPKNATNKALKVEVLGNDNGVISAPNVITAGEDFTLDVKQDTKGNNIGGVVTVKASQGIAEVTMTVIVDVDIPDNSLYFTGDDAGKITTSGKSFTMAISDNTQYVYLKSNLVNAFFLQANNENMKNVDISYVYTKESGEKVEKNVSSESEIDRKYNAHDNVYNYFYKVPLVTDQAGTIDITAKMHRTSEIESIFKSSKFENLPTLLRNQNNSSADREAATLTLSKYNDFLNKYIQYFDNSAESYSFFKNAILSDGKITLSNLSQVVESFNYIYVGCSATINVTAIKLSDFTSMDTPREYDVALSSGSEVLFSVSGNNARNIVEDFNLKIKTDNDEAVGADQKKDYMFESLAVKPYLYIDINSLPTNSYDEIEHKIAWEGRQYKYTNVFGLDGHTPITKQSDDYSEVIGYLLELENSDEYISITQLSVQNEKHWKLSCNVPMVNDQSEIGIVKALYLGFEISGIGKDTNSMITIESFTRIYVNYEDLDFVYDDVSNIAINSLDKYMSINTSDIQVKSTQEEIDDPDSYYNQLTVGRYTQNITNNMNNTNISNLNTASYQNIMYFAETASNKIDGEYSKIATVGRYNFISYANANSSTNFANYYMFEDEQLVGERLATYKMVNNKKQYYLHALNASNEPVRLFAVIYLSDKNGYPIDVNGRRIEISEGDEAEQPTTLIVLRISDITADYMPSVYIQSYVDNINFYTKSNVQMKLKTSNVGTETDEEVTFETGFINRNHLNYMETETGDRISDTLLGMVHDYLSLKLLKNNYFSLYITNFDLSSDGAVNLDANTLTEIECTDFFGKKLNMGYSIYNYSNKQYAFNLMCSDFNNYNLYTDSQDVKVYGSPEIISSDGEWVAGTGMNATMIRFVLHSSKDDDANIDPKIYLNPENSTIPYSRNLIYSESDGQNQIARNNYVIYHTNKLEISDVQVSTNVTLQNKLQARYKKIVEGVDKGDLTFSFNGDNGSTGEYILPIVNGNISYYAVNNLMSENKSNLDLVDCSQSGKIDNPEGMEGVYFYENLDQYIAYYTTLPNASAITYTTAESIVSLAEDMRFSNILQETVAKNKLYFGNKEYDVMSSGTIGTVNINGYTVDVEMTDVSKEIWELVIPSGTIFPLVNGDKVLIYNEIFEVTTSDNINFYIKDYYNNELGITGNSIKVNKSAKILLSDGTWKNYDASKYIDDTMSAIQKESSSGDSYATVNFLQGEELGRFVEDNNGTYKKVVDVTNSNAYTYELIDGTEEPGAQKYSISGLNTNNKKMGVKVYMIVTIPFIFNAGTSSYEYTFYKAIEYELLQEEIKIISYNTPGTDNVNTNVNPLKVTAGNTANPTKIALGVINNDGARITIQANNENYFFEHVTFKITSTNIKGVSVAVDSDKTEFISVSIPDLASNNTFVIQMQYLYKNNETVTVNFYVEAVANVEFTHDTSKVNIKDISASEKAYVVTLASGTEHNVADIFEDKFTIGDNVNKVILKDGNTEYPTSITLSNVNADYDGTTIRYGSKVYTIVLQLTSGNKIELDYKLYVEIVPTYVIDTTRVEDNVEITMYNGDYLYGNYVRLLNGSSTISDIGNTDKILPYNNEGYVSVFSLTTDTDTLALLDATAFAKGQIKLKTLPTTDTTLQLTLKYTTYTGAIAEREFSVVVRGVDMKYSPTGTITGGSDTQTLNKNITITVPQGTTSIDIATYLQFSLSNQLELEDAIMAVLIDGSGNAITKIEGANLIDGATYTIGYSKSTNGSGFVLVGSVGYTVTISIVTA